MKEIEKKVSSGIGAFLVGLLFLIIDAAMFVYTVSEMESSNPNPGKVIIFVSSIALFMILMFISKGFFTLQPNEAAIFTLFGKYKGTSKNEGWNFVNPFYTRRKISLRLQTLDGDRLKVNDEMGNPIEIAAIVIWKVCDTAKAIFDVESYVEYVRTQTETSLRHLAGLYPYDLGEDEQGHSLRTGSDEIIRALKKELQEKLSVAGISIEDARLSHLAYSPEIAAVMLQRQQATAVIAARQKIVEGAVGMVEMALKKLNERDVVILDEERKAAMVSNLLVVLCGDKNAQAVINAGTLYN